MKNFFVCIAVTVFSVVGDGNGQEKPKRDLGYSMNNYKHQNKAAAAKAWEQNRVNTLVVKKGSFKGLNLTNTASNYKAHDNRPKNDALFLITTRKSFKHETNPSAIPGNYKKQHITTLQKIATIPALEDDTVAVEGGN